MAVADGSLKSGDDTFRSTFDEDGNFFSGVIRTQPSQPSTVQVEYRLPGYVLKPLGAGKFEYSLELVAQPGAQERGMSIRVQFPEDATVLNTNFGQVSKNVVTIDQPLASDMTVNIRFATK